MIPILLESEKYIPHLLMSNNDFFFTSFASFYTRFYDLKRLENFTVTNTVLEPDIPDLICSHIFGHVTPLLIRHKILEGMPCGISVIYLCVRGLLFLLERFYQ